MALLKEFKTPFGTIRITRERDGTLAYYQNGCFHSQATPRGISICAYVHMVYHIIRQKKARDVLIIGCGGGTLATMLSRHDVRVTVVDINPAAFTIARDYFSMPDDVQCIKHNGLTYVRKTKQRFDAVVIDVFDEHNNVPRGFITTSFLKSVHAILKRGGVAVMNVIAKDAKDNGADDIARHVEAAGMKATIYEWSRHKHSNRLIVGGSMKPLSLAGCRMPAAIKQELKKLSARAPKQA